MSGFSDTLLKNHFTSIRATSPNTNKLWNCWRHGEDGKEGTPEFAELKRRQGWEFQRHAAA